MVTCRGIFAAGKIVRLSLMRSGPEVRSSFYHTLQVHVLIVGVVMGYTSDGFPFVGDVPGKPGQYVCAGFSGHGMPQVFLSAKSIASMVVDEKSVGETDLPKPYHSTQERFDSKSQHISLAAFDTVLTKLGMKN